VLNPVSVVYTPRQHRIMALTMESADGSSVSGISSVAFLVFTSQPFHVTAKASTPREKLPMDSPSARLTLSPGYTVNRLQT
jgi:hypothetical protein